MKVLPMDFRRLQNDLEEKKIKLYFKKKTYK